MKIIIIIGLAELFMMVFRLCLSALETLSTVLVNKRIVEKITIREKNKREYKKYIHRDRIEVRIEEERVSAESIPSEHFSQME